MRSWEIYVSFEDYYRTQSGFCRKKLESESSIVTREWGSWLRATSRRRAVQVRSKWLRDEGNDDWGDKSRTANSEGFQTPNFQQSGSSKNMEGIKTISKASMGEIL